MNRPGLALRGSGSERGGEGEKMTERGRKRERTEIEREGERLRERGRKN